MTPDILFALWVGLLIGWGTAGPAHRFLWSLRVVHRVYAGTHNYFWEPCPSCGRHFGGHEWRSRDGHESSIPRDGSLYSGWGICPKCTDDGVGDRAYEALRERIRERG